MQTILTIPITSVIEGDRARKDYGDLSGLKSSIQRIGTIHPPALSRRIAGPSEMLLAHEGYVYDLVAGGRRFRSIRELGHKVLSYGSMLNPNLPGFLFREDVPEDELREAELDENLYRLKPKWQEDCLLVADVHRLKRQREGTKWGQRQTAELLGPGYGLSNVNLALKVAELLIAKDKDIMSADSLMEANTIRIKRREEEAVAQLQKLAFPAGAAPALTPLPAFSDTSSFLDSFNMDLGADIVPGTAPSTAMSLLGGGIAVTQARASAPTLQPGPLVSSPAVVIPLSSMFQSGDWRTHTWIPTNHIITDIPYAIDMDNLGKKQVADVKEEHEVIANLELMLPFLQKSFDSILPHGFCVFFYDLDHHEKLQQWATEVGWKVQRWPLVWAKTHTCKNQSAQYNTTKNFEVAMILRKDEHTVLRCPQTSSVWTGDGAAERKCYNNPFAKPYELWKWIYDMVAFPGQSVRDPYCGEMSACRAAANCGLVPYGNEINPVHYNRGLEHMKAVYALIHKSNVQFI